MKINLLKGKKNRNRIFALISVLSVLLLLVLNLVITYFGVQRSLYVDLTPEGLYTLTDKMKEECSFIDEDLGEGGKKVKITFCADPDTLISAQITRLIYFMAIQMDNTFENLEVETVNIAYNPTAVSKYKPTSFSDISYSDIIVSYGDRYRVVNANNFWVTADDALWAFNGEYKMASVIMSVTNKNRPSAYFVTGHGETYYDVGNPASEGSIATAAFYDLLTERGLAVGTVDLSQEEIPEDCLLLIINNPTEDFTYDKDRLDELNYVTETEKIDRYLVNEQGAVMVAKDYARELPVLESFLYEWGFDFGEALVKDESAHVSTEGEQFTSVIGQYDTDADSYGYAIYGDLAALPTAPSMVFENTGYIESSFGADGTSNEPGTYSASRNYAPFFYTTSEARAYGKNSETGTYIDLEKEYEALDIAGVTTRMEIDDYTSEYKYSYMFCSASADFFSGGALANASYANFDVMSALVENMARTDEYASIELGGVSFNSDNVGGKPLTETNIYTTNTTEYDKELGKNVVVYRGLTSDSAITITILLLALPLAIAAVGAVICVKRKFL